MDTKVCSTCGEDKPLSEFNKNKARKDGYQQRCKACRTIHYKQDYAENRDKYLARNQKRRADWREFLNSLKLKCVICGEEHPWCLEFHHKNRDEKEISFSDVSKNYFSD